MMVKASTVRVAWAAGLIVTLSAGLASAQGPDKPSWRCLPKQTVGALWAPNLAKVGEQLEARTKMGRMLLGGELEDKFMRLVKQDAGDQWQKIKDNLAEYGLKPSDGQKLLVNGMGVSLIAQPRPEHPPVMVVLGWANPGEETGARLMSALKKGLAEEMEDEPQMERFDIEIAGQEVVHHSKPVWEQAEHEPRPAEEGAPVNGRDMPKRFIAGRIHTMVTRMDGRMIGAMTIPTSQARVKAMAPADREDIDWDQMTGLERAKGVLARFITAHDGADGPFAQQMRRTPGVSQALPDGTPVMEGYINTPEIFRLVEKYAKRGELGGPDAQQLKLMKQLGLFDIGPLAMRMSLDGRTMRSGFMLGSQAPRKGVLKLLNQPSHKPTVPGWVSSNVLGYAHFSLDLDQVYRTVKQLTIDQMGQMARQNFASMERMVKQQTQEPLPALLGSIGSKHMMVTFEPKMIEIAAPGRQPGPPGEQQNQPRMKVPQNRVGLVWNLQNPNAVQKLFNFANQFAQMNPQIQSAREQGFSGFRINNPRMPMGIFRDQEHLAMGIGEGVSSKVLSMLRNPPEGDKALRNTALVARGRALLPPKPGLFYAVQDYGRQLKGLRKIFMTSFELALSQGGDDAERARRWVKALLPKGKAFREAVGVAVSQGRVTDNGLVAETALELAPAE